MERIRLFSRLRGFSQKCIDEASEAYSPSSSKIGTRRAPAFTLMVAVLSLLSFSTAAQRVDMKAPHQCGLDGESWDGGSCEIWFGPSGPAGPSVPSAEEGPTIGLYIQIPRDPGPGFYPSLMPSYTPMGGVGAPIVAPPRPDTGFEGETDCSASMPSTRHPVVITTGNKTLSEVDVPPGSGFPTGFRRTYSKAWDDTVSGLFGKNWASTFDYKLSFVYQDGPSSKVCVVLPGTSGPARLL